MPRLLLMADVRTRCQQRANMEGDPSIGTPEWNSLISEVYGETYEEVADAGGRYFETTVNVTTNGAGYIDEPVDQLALVDNIELVIDATTNRVRRLRQIQPQERAALSGLTGDPCRYEMVDDRFFLYPKPPTGKVLTLRYIPQSPDLSAAADADTLDVFCAAGEAFLIWGVAAIAKSKDERFVDFAETQKEKARARLQQWARQRAFNEPMRRIVDSDSGIDTDFDYDWRGGIY